MCVLPVLTVRSSISTPVSTSQRAGSPGRKAVLSVAPPPIVSTVTTGSSHVQHQHQHRRSSSSSASSPCSPAAAGVGGGGGATSSRRKTSVPLVHQLHSPLSRSHSAGKSLAIDEDVGEQMTEVERCKFPSCCVFVHHDNPSPRLALEVSVCAGGLCTLWMRYLKLHYPNAHYSLV